MSEKVKNKKVTDERFSFAFDNVELHDQKLETKARGYFADAFFRFRRNKASLVATVIIGFILLFALLVPMLTPPSVQTLMDPYYSKKGPRNTDLYSIGINGAQNKTVTDRVLYYEYAKGLRLSLLKKILSFQSKRLVNLTINLLLEHQKLLIPHQDQLLTVILRISTNTYL